jgi:hypothetical protein
VVVGWGLAWRRLCPAVVEGRRGEDPHGEIVEKECSSAQKYQADDCSWRMKTEYYFATSGMLIRQ